jgi:carbamoyl-phosphate synthase large subunit
MGWSIERVHELSKIYPWFLAEFEQLVRFEDTLASFKRLEDLPRETLFEAKRLGYSDAQLANLYLGRIAPETILAVRAHRKSQGIEPVYKLVDTCAAEFEAVTPYYYSTYEAPFTATESRVRRRDSRERSREDRHSRRRTEPHRAGHRVRLLLLSSGVCREVWVSRA